MTNLKFFTAGALALTLAAPLAAQTAVIGYDVDGDGELTGAEFRDAFEKAGMTGRFDVNGDAMLDKDEFAAYYDGLEVEGGDADAALASYDADGDGVLNTAEYNEAFFAGYDLNEDGALDADELVELEADVNDDL